MSTDGGITEAALEAINERINQWYRLEHEETAGAETVINELKFTRDKLAALAAQKGEGVREGWQMVPVEPDTAMIIAGVAANQNRMVGEVYSAMLAVAPVASPTPASWNEAERNMVIEACGKVVVATIRSGKGLNHALNEIRALTRPDPAPGTYIAANGEELPDGMPGTAIINDGRPT